jgi:DNA (cytosine-5)-methyltransferase 1
MMGLPAGWVTDVVPGRSHQLRILGNGVVPQQAAYALSLLARQAAAS